MTSPYLQFNVLEAQSKHQQMVDLIHRTHQIYTGIRGADIVLIKDNPPGRTDTETFVSIPIEDPEADLIHKHEWQHIFFKSNLRARAAFAEAYSTYIKSRVHTADRKALEDFIHLLVNGLDDLRVCSLWRLIYPHSADAIEQRWRTVILGTARYQSDIIMFMMGLGLGIESQMGRSEWMRYKHVLKTAVGQVLGMGFPTCLLAARWIIEAIMMDVANQNVTPDSHMLKPPQSPKAIASAGHPQSGSKFQHMFPYQNTAWPVTPEEEKKQSKMLSSLHDGAKKLPHRATPLRDAMRFMDTDVMPRGPDPDERGTEDMVRVALGVSDEYQLNLVLKQSQLDVERIINELRNRTTVLTPAQRLLKGLEGVVALTSVPSEAVEELKLSYGDIQTSNTMRHSFMRLMDQKRQVRSETGSTLDPQAYIDFLAGSLDTDIFIEEENSKGFSALILLDMSGSMREKWDAVARACKVIVRAMKFPCSRLEVWGFSSNGNGRVSMLHFENPEKGYDGPGVVGVWGLTPLHIAVDVSIRRLQVMPGSAQHLIVLTDGYPTHISVDREIVTDAVDLFSEVSRLIQAGRKRGVNVAGLVSGNEIPDSAATLMFGKKKYWERVSERQEDLFHALVGLAKKAFTGYLRGR